MALSDAEMTVIVSIVGPVLGAGVALVSTSLSNRAQAKRVQTELEHQKKRELQEINRARGEELYQIVAHWVLNVFSAHISLYSVMKGQMSYNDYLDIHNSTQFSKALDHQRLEMLIDVYFPAVRPFYGDAQAALTKHNDVVAKHKHAYNRGEDGRHFLKPFQVAQIEFEQQGERLKAAIIDELKKT